MIGRIIIINIILKYIEIFNGTIPNDDTYQYGCYGDKRCNGLLPIYYLCDGYCDCDECIDEHLLYCEYIGFSCNVNPEFLDTNYPGFCWECKADRNGYIRRLPSHLVGNGRCDCPLCDDEYNNTCINKHYIGNINDVTNTTNITCFDCGNHIISLDYYGNNGIAFNLCDGYCDCFYDKCSDETVNCTNFGLLPESRIEQYNCSIIDDIEWKMLYYCDHWKRCNCLDCDDEKYCYNNSQQISNKLCGNFDFIPLNFMCNNLCECPGCIDEDDSLCFECSNDPIPKKIFAFQRCDNHWDCFYGADEIECPCTEENVEFRGGVFHKQNNCKCANRSSTETQYSGCFQCDNGDRVLSCDGLCDCINCEDEIIPAQNGWCDCKNKEYNKCFNCTDINTINPIHKVISISKDRQKSDKHECDGYYQCLHHNDEINCKYYKVFNTIHVILWSLCFIFTLCIIIKHKLSGKISIYSRKCQITIIMSLYALYKCLSSYICQHMQGCFWIQGYNASNIFIYIIFLYNNIKFFKRVKEINIITFKQYFNDNIGKCIFAKSVLYVYISYNISINTNIYMQCYVWLLCLEV